MVVLLVASYKSLNKGLSLYHTETMIIKNNNNNSNSNNNNNSNYTTHNSIDKSKHNNNNTHISTKPDELPLHYTLKQPRTPGGGHNSDLSQANDADDDDDNYTNNNKKRKLDYNILLLILCIWLYYILIYFILHTIFTICTLSYFMVFAVSFIPILIAIPVIIIYLSRKQQLQQQAYNNNNNTATPTTTNNNNNSNNSHSIYNTILSYLSKQPYQLTSSGGGDDKIVLLEGDIYFNNKSIYTYILPCISLIAGILQPHMLLGIITIFYYMLYMMTCYI